ncbi:MAG: flagellar hook-associated protein FlgK [Methylophilaceae bacterium]
MATSILSIGQSALSAAQVGISVTGHNIANASTPGYSRQEVVQRAAEAQDFGFGYLGQGAQVSQIRRAYNDIIAQQMNRAQNVSSSTNTYASQLKQIDNMLADSTAGLSPSMQNFFAGIQNLATNPGDAATRQAVLSSGQTIVNRFQSINDRINEIRQGVNTQLQNDTKVVTSYATEIAKLNDVISKAIGANKNSAPNDVMDKRDNLIAEMNKFIKTDVIKQDDGSYNVFIGNGVPLVVGNKSYAITTVSSSTDPTELEVAYVTNVVKPLGANSLTGGSIGGLTQFRNESLDSVQNQIGQIATVFAQTFNDQHKLGFDSNGVAGGNFFNVSTPKIYSDTANSSGATLTTTISNVSAITSSDYRVKYDGTNYNITKVSDGSIQSFSSLPQTLDGLTFNGGSMVAGDSFLVEPVRDGAKTISLAINDIRKIAAGDATGGAGNNRNALLLAGLQSKGTLNNSSISYEGAFAQLVSQVGIKTNELRVNAEADTAILAQTTAAQQSESGVNLDEEATNLLRYQQAYQAAGKVMQIASTLFDLLLTIGR